MVGRVAGVAVVGDIVWAPVAFTDLSGSKSRPVLVLAEVGMRDSIVCQITSRQPGRPGEISITNQDMQSGSLTYDSWVRPNRLHTINQRRFSHPIAQVGAGKLDEVLEAVRGLFLSIGGP